MTPDASSFLSRCVSIDLEVDPKSARLFAFAAVRGERAVVHKGAALEPALDRLGDAAMLLISPEQLRSPSIRTVLQQREVGLWVLDEAHCVSKWGHDFRPDYRYVSRFIKEFSGDSPAPVLCLTATAKPEVVRDIRDHFQTRLGVDLMLLDGGAVRTNLSFAVLPTQKATKLTDILSAIEASLPPEGASGAVVYCATRGATERVAEFLKGQGLAADYFHAGLPPDRKRDVQEAFRTGQLRVIAATNAFGMGIDKPDIRLVVHGDIPGSLENYLQEAGRAGRDRAPANCVLLFSPEDVERQFSLSARSRLIGDDAAGVTVSTCHALAMRLMGASFAGDHEGPRDFDGIVLQAVALLRGEGRTKAEAEALRETLIQGYRWLLVDEYQDIGPEEYALIGAVAGRSLEDDLRISLFAVGDDDQNIYAFAGASIDFIRRFEADYSAKPVWLTENYRSTAHIIAAANAAIAPAAQRMKAGHDITVNRARAKAMPGGDWAALDPVAQGRVSLLDAGGDAAQAVAALDELQRLSQLVPDWSWRRCAVIARDWRRLEPVRAYAEALGIPIDMANEKPLTLWRMREMQGFVRALLADRTRLLTIPDLVAILNAQPQSRWTDLIGEGIGTLARELVEKAAPVPDIVQWFGEWARDVRGEQRGLLLMTAHRAKGLEFDHVAILNGGWDRPSRGEDADAPRRLFYVAMTRARSTLTVLTDGQHAFVQPGDAVLSRRVTPDAAALPRARLRYVPPDPKLVDLSFAGRLRPGDPSLAAIAAARPGDPVHLIRDGDRWRMGNAQGQTLARLSRAFAPPEGTTFLRGEVAAVLNWRREDGDEEYNHLLRRDEWEVVLPELVFESPP